jgi:hypothetical protein
MVKMDPLKAVVTLPDDYLIAIGKVCVQWGILEHFVELVLLKLAELPHDSTNGKIIVNHMSWPQKMDIINSLVDQLLPQYPRLAGYDEQVVPLLKKAQEGRNRIIHGFWATPQKSSVLLLRATARGKLKLYADEMTVTKIEAVLADINNAAAAIYNKVIGTE